MSWHETDEDIGKRRTQAGVIVDRVAKGLGKTLGPIERDDLIDYLLSMPEARALFH